MPLSADPPPRLKVGILWDADCIASNAAAVVDVLRTLQNLAAMRSPPAPVLAWEWLVLDASDIPCGGLPPAGGGGADGPHDVLVIPGTMAVSGPHLQEISQRQAQRARDTLHRHVGCG
ncbi:MAG TPA: AraC family transcriptional regulator, partial [Giesbergeria sp.]|nr:AraC family transcriptional regulator [Giesbergeria sp.]